MFLEVLIVLTLATMVFFTYTVIFTKQNKETVYKTACYCPLCNNELIGSGSFVSDFRLVTYKCVECEIVSNWDFDAPVPLLIECEIDERG